MGGFLFDMVMEMDKENIRSPEEKAKNTEAGR
jgi:hypothetical protein